MPSRGTTAATKLGRKSHWMRLKVLTCGVFLPGRSLEMAEIDGKKTWEVNYPISWETNIVIVIYVTYYIDYTSIYITYYIDYISI